MPPPKLYVLSASNLTKSAGGDPWHLQDQLLAGDPLRISTMAEAFHKTGSHVGQANSAFDTARRHFRDAYTSDGTDVIDDSATVQDASSRLHGSADALSKIGTSLEQIAAALATAQNTTHTHINALDKELKALESEYDNVPANMQTRRAAFQAEILPELQDAAVKVVAATYRQLKGTVDGYENLLDQHMTKLESAGYLPPIELDSAASNTDPKKVYAWWTQLTPAEKKAMIDAHADVIGNLNGIPVADRDTANRQVMDADLGLVEGLAKSEGVSVDAILKDPVKYCLTPDAVTRYRNASNVRAGLAAYGLPSPPRSGRYPTYLYAYQPLAFGGKGRAAIAIGNPDTAANTAVVVPGASQSVRASDGSDKGWFAVQNAQAKNLYEESNAADPSHHTAVVAWMGYDDPTNGITAVASANPSAERAGGNLLAQDVNGLQATHQGASHVTVVGYSAGAIVTSDAAAASHMHADDVVLLGPVSTDQAHNAADFHLDRGGHVYVGEASHDLNAHGGHTYLDTVSHVTSQGGEADPTSPDYGAVQIRAEAPAKYDTPIIGYTPEDHLHYFDAGSDSLRATSEIVAAQVDSLARDHLLAGSEGGEDPGQ
ncbi:putative alpha/beta hydrolase [Nocardia jiangxiensis]|uniref:putative alpha/beta hydrolase n=1 Tax=Nocardia jiangxiensis TaxID=282685 RepID=UPI00030993AB|nr:alpha/beta hydrolase [Nocardia jiangxiensis]